MAREVLAHHLGAPPRRIVAKGGGLNNCVFEADHREGAFVVRIAQAQEKLNAYLKEQWAIGRAAQAGVPAPEVLEVGNDLIGAPYMIERKVVGVAATEHPRRLEIVREMGRLLASLHRVRTQGFGETFDWSANRLSRNSSWTEFLDCEHQVDRRIATLRRHRMLTEPALKRLRRAVAAMRGWRKPAVLNHGDMRLKNVIVGEDARIRAVIDWEDSISGAGGAWDLSIALHDLAIDAKQALLEGYGLREREILARAPAWKALNLLNYASEVEALAARKNRAALGMYRARLHGALDLYGIY